MIWTHLRSCYGFDMRVFVGGVEKIYPARWFFCDPLAEWFPSPHGAEASPWLKDGEINEAWGEIKGRKTLDRGINPGYPGQCFVGELEWFVDGHVPAVVDQYVPPKLTPCCGHVPCDYSDSRCPQPPIVCAPFRFISAKVHLFFRCSFGTFEFGQTVIPERFTLGFFDPSIAFNTIVVVNRITHPPTPDEPCPPVCLGPSIFTDNSPLHDGVGPFDLTYVSYDPVTLTGTYTVPPAIQTIGGETVQIWYIVEP